MESIHSMFQMKVFEKKETTDKLLGEIDNIIEFVNSHKTSE